MMNLFFSPFLFCWASLLGVYFFFLPIPFLLRDVRRYRRE
jgi:hypothetical protein